MAGMSAAGVFADQIARHGQGGFQISFRRLKRARTLPDDLVGKYAGSRHSSHKRNLKTLGLKSLGSWKRS